ncbi:MAG: hypothetical protein HYY18_03665 [Planctomycetes bacterium]|nr:hypothetical protein [Planctomycetota bacterium]
MPDRIRKVAHFNASVPNEPGAGARLLEALRDAGVNLLACWGYPTGEGAQIEMVPEKPALFVRAAAKAGLRLGPRQESILITGTDRPGAMAETFHKLATAGINIGASQGVATGNGRWGAVVYLPPKLIPNAMKALRRR